VPPSDGAARARRGNGTGLASDMNRDLHPFRLWFFATNHAVPHKSADDAVRLESGGSPRPSRSDSDVPVVSSSHGESQGSPGWSVCAPAALWHHK
jgi:hypothetical protein